MKYVKIQILGLITAFIVFAAPVFAEDYEGGYKVSRGDELRVSIPNGNISVKIWDKDEVYIKAGKIDPDDVKFFEARQSGKLVSVNFIGQDSKNFYLEISMPSYMVLDFATGGGNISVNSNISGSARISTGGGNVNLKDIGAGLSLATGGGEVFVGNVEGDTEISTGGGNINTGDIKGEAEVTTGGGNITIGRIDGKGEISTAGGNISVRRVSGSAEISTAGGNIALESAVGKIEANTAGGNLNLKNIDGSVEANTAGGNIYSELTPSAKVKSEFNTAGGDINLLIPAGAKVNIEASVYAGKTMDQSEAEQLIKSDFEAATIDFNKNTLIKRFVLNGGGSEIELNTASGKIKIGKK